MKNFKNFFKTMELILEGRIYAEDYEYTEGIGIPTSTLIERANDDRIADGWHLGGGMIGSTSYLCWLLLNNPHKFKIVSEEVFPSESL